jgi:hypothetical protein
MKTITDRPLLASIHSEWIGMIARSGRLLKRDGPPTLECAASKILNSLPRIVNRSAASMALMEERNRRLAVARVDGLALGVVHLHYLLAADLI